MAIVVTQAVVETFIVAQATTQVINLPTFAVNDFVLVALNHSPDGTAGIGTVTIPAGWDQFGNSTPTGAASDSRLTIIGRVMQGGDGGTVSVTTSTTMTVGAIAVNAEGVDLTTQEDATTPAMNTGTGGALCPSITTVTDGALVVRFGIVDAVASPIQDGDQPGGTTLRGAMDNNPPSNGMSLGVADAIQASAGASGTATWGNGGTEEMVGATIALRPAPEGPTIITAVPDPMDDQEPGVVLSGNTFEAVQGAGIVEMGDSADHGTANLVLQTVTAWADDEITITAELGAQTPTGKFMFVTNDSAQLSPGFPFVMRREQAIALVASPNIPASGADTTFQLTAPSGKSTTDFGGGRIQDDENPGDPVDLGEDEYREDEWSFEALPAAVEGETYQFRVLIDGVVQETITETPQFTISDITVASGAVTAPGGYTSTGTATLEFEVSGTVAAPAATATGTSTPISPLMYAVRDFQVPLAGGDQDIDFGFEVKVAYAFWTGCSEILPDDFEADASQGVGFFDGTNYGYAASGFGNSPDGEESHGTDLFIKVFDDGTGGTVPEATASSIATGLRLNWSPAASGASQQGRIIIVGIGGTAASAEVGSALVSAGAVTGLSIAPEMVLLATAGLAGDPASAQDFASMSFGVFDGSNQWSLSSFSWEDTDPETDKHSVLGTDLCLGSLGSGGYFWEMTVPVLTASGFSWTGTDTDTFIFMAVNLSGAGTAIGAFIKEVSGVNSTTQQVPSMGFDPGIVVFATASEVDEDEANNNNARWSIGADDGSAPASVYVIDVAGTNNAAQKWFQESIPVGQTNHDALGSITDINRNDPTILWSLSDTTPAIIGYIGFGMTISAIAVMGAVTAPGGYTAAGSAALVVPVLGAVTAPAATASGTAVIGHPAQGTPTAPAATADGTLVFQVAVSGAAVIAVRPEVFGIAGLVQFFGALNVDAPTPTANGVATLGHPVSGSVTGPSAQASGQTTLGHTAFGGGTAPGGYLASGAVTVERIASGAVTAPGGYLATGTAALFHDASGAVDAPTQTSTGTLLLGLEAAGSVSPTPMLALGFVDLPIQYALRDALVPTSPGTQDIDFGFDVEIAYAYWVGGPAVTPDSFTTQATQGVGFFDGTNYAFCSSGYGNSGAGQKASGTDLFIKVFEQGSVLTVPEATVSKIPGGLRLNWTTAASSANQRGRVFIAGIGGGVAAEIGAVRVNESPVTGMAFEPDVVLLATVGLNTDPVVDNDHSSLSFGCFNATDQWVLAQFAFRGAPTNPEPNKHSIVDSTIPMASMDESGFVWEMSAPVLTSDGFSWSAPDVDDFVYYMAMNLIRANPTTIGTILKKTDGTGSQFMPDLGFNPGLLMFATASDVDENPATAENARWVIGVTDGDKEFAIYTSSFANQNAAVHNHWIDRTIVTGQDTLDSETVLFSDWGTVSPRLFWLLNDTDPTILAYLAFSSFRRVVNFFAINIGPAAPTAAGAADIKPRAIADVTAPGGYTAAGTVILEHPVSGSVTAPVPTASGTADVQFLAFGDVTAPGGYVAIGEAVQFYQVSGAVTIPPPTLASSAILVHEVSGSVAPAAPTVAPAEVVQKFFVTAALVTPAALATGTAVAAKVAAGNVTAPVPTATGTAALEHAVSGAVDAPTITATGTADTLQTTAAGSVLAPAAQASGSAVMFFLASGSVLAPAPTVTGAATLCHPLSGTVSAPAVTATGTGSKDTIATGAVDAPVITAAGAAAAVLRFQGEVSAPSPDALGTTTLGLLASGSVLAPAPQASGQVVSFVEASGTPSAPAPLALGQVVMAFDVSGSVLAPGGHPVFGSLTLCFPADGTVSAVAPTATGTATAPNRASGFVLSPSPSAAGSATLCHPAAGSVTSPAATSFGTALSTTADFKLSCSISVTTALNCDVTLTTALRCAIIVC